MRFIIDFLVTLLHYRPFSKRKNFGDLGGSIVSLLKPYDILFFVDVFLLIYLCVSKKIQKDYTRVGYKKAVAVIAFVIGLSVINLGLANVDRPQLLTRGFDRNYIVKF